MTFLPFPSELASPYLSRRAVRLWLDGNPYSFRLSSLTFAMVAMDKVCSACVARCDIRMVEKSRIRSLDVLAEVALRVLEVCGGVGEGEAEGVADGDEGGHEGAEAGDGHRVGVARQGPLEHDVAHEQAARRGTHPLE